MRDKAAKARVRGTGGKSTNSKTVQKKKIQIIIFNKLHRKIGEIKFRCYPIFDVPLIFTRRSDFHLALMKCNASSKVVRCARTVKLDSPSTEITNEKKIEVRGRRRSLSPTACLARGVENKGKNRMIRWLLSEVRGIARCSGNSLIHFFHFFVINYFFYIYIYINRFSEGHERIVHALTGTNFPPCCAYCAIRDRR